MPAAPTFPTFDTTSTPFLERSDSIAIIRSIHKLRRACEAPSPFAPFDSLAWHHGAVAICREHRLPLKEWYAACRAA